jgi:hypothetical protein
VKVGDLIRFTSTGCHGLVTEVRAHGANEYVHVLCGADADGIDSGEARVFPQFYITSVAEVINGSR